MSGESLWLVLAFPLAYLWGGVPWGLLVSRVARGVDPRRYGSGSIGMANVLRTVGVKAGLTVLALDLAKGALAVGLARWAFPTPWAPPAVGLAVMAGHIWSPYIGLRGGKGTAPGLGGLFLLHPLAGTLAALVGTGALLRTRFVSVGSLLGAVSGGLALGVMGVAGWVPPPYTLYGGVGALLVVWAHRPNIARLLRGEEYRLGEAARPIPEASAGEKGPWRS
jgi:glycerol-3-phosphate acyltransferase PlsY